MHCHFQIEYTGIDPEYEERIQIESFIGFHPANDDDRKLLHDCLDDYLDYLQERTRIAREWREDSFEPLNENNRFIVFDHAD